MSQNQVTVIVQEYPDNDAKPEVFACFESHWNWGDRVSIRIGSERHVYLISDVEKALEAVRRGK